MSGISWKWETDITFSAVAKDHPLEWLHMYLKPQGPALPGSCALRPRQIDTVGMVGRNNAFHSCLEVEGRSSI